MVLTWRTLGYVLLVEHEILMLLKQPYCTSYFMGVMPNFQPTEVRFSGLVERLTTKRNARLHRTFSSGSTVYISWVMGDAK